MADLPHGYARTGTPRLGCALEDGEAALIVAQANRSIELGLERDARRLLARLTDAGIFPPPAAILPPPLACKRHAFDGDRCSRCSAPRKRSRNHAEPTSGAAPAAGGESTAAGNSTDGPAAGGAVGAIAARLETGVRPTEDATAGPSTNASAPPPQAVARGARHEEIGAAWRAFDQIRHTLGLRPRRDWLDPRDEEDHPAFDRWLESYTSHATATVAAVPAGPAAQESPPAGSSTPAPAGEVGAPRAEDPEVPTRWLDVAIGHDGTARVCATAPETFNRPATPPCRRCGAEVEEPRACYVTPMCYACLPPPPPLPVAPLRSQTPAPQVPATAPTGDSRESGAGGLDVGDDLALAFDALDGAVGPLVPHAAFVPDTRAKVDWLARLLLELQERRERIVQAANARAAQIDAEIQSLCYRYGDALEAWLRAELVAQQKGKRALRSVHLDEGRIGLRKVGGGIEIDRPVASKWAEEHDDPITPAFGQWRYVLDAKALKDHVAATGEDLPGVTRVQERDVLYLQSSLRDTQGRHVMPQIVLSAGARALASETEEE